MNSRILICFSIWLIFSFQSTGTHIVGGELTSRFITGNTFEIKLVLYRDCQIGVTGFDKDITIGVFDLLTDSLVKTETFPLDFYQTLIPSGISCTTPKEICVEEGIYTGMVFLKDNPNGYYIAWERCCRNHAVVNINKPGETGMAFYHEIPDPSLKNTSPFFVSPPLPYVCEENYFEYMFNAVDPDGDSLVYELVNPLAGHAGTSGGSGNPPILPQPFPAPYPEISWSQGYNLSNLAGGTPVTVNFNSGLVSGTPVDQGLFAMSIMVSEYRDGLKIGEIRREIEFAVLPCTENSAPNLPPSINNAIYYVYPTDILQFLVVVIDQNSSDSLELTFEGDVFQGGSANPPFAQSQNTSGVGSVSVPFSWNIECGHIRSEPYQVNYTIVDNGCPLPKTVTGTFLIYVLPPPLVSPVNLVCMRKSGTNELEIRFADASSPNPYFSEIQIFRSINGSAFSKYDVINDESVRTWTDKNAPGSDLKNYCYFFRGVNVCGHLGLPSDTICSVFKSSADVNYIISVGSDEENALLLEFDYLPDYRYSTVHIERKLLRQPESEFRQISALHQTNVNKFRDENVSTNDLAYCYRIQTTNLCEIKTAYSNTACTILLTGQSQSGQNNLSWNPYRGWKRGTGSHEISIIADNQGAPLQKIVLPGNAVFYQDHITYFNEGAYRYRVMAKENKGSFNAVSLSNEMILYQNPEVFIPNTFTPNRDGVNDTWICGCAFVDTYKVSVFNRWGQVVYSSENTNEDWDGTYRGKQVPEGVYFFRVFFSGSESQEIKTKTGWLNVVR